MYLIQYLWESICVLLFKSRLGSHMETQSSLLKIPPSLLPPSPTILYPRGRTGPPVTQMARTSPGGTHCSGLNFPPKDISDVSFHFGTLHFMAPTSTWGFAIAKCACMHICIPTDLKVLPGQQQESHWYPEEHWKRYQSPLEGLYTGRTPSSIPKQHEWAHLNRESVNLLFLISLWGRGRGCLLGFLVSSELVILHPSLPRGLQKADPGWLHPLTYLAVWLLTGGISRMSEGGRRETRYFFPVHTALTLYLSQWLGPSMTLFL